MSAPSAPSSVPHSGALAALVFRTAIAFLVVTALLGAILRLLALRPVGGWEYGNLLHTHSHLGFLGWVFNAFVALAAVRFLPPGKEKGFRRLFFVLQVAVAGMLVSYPLQGYGAASIAFSTLHMGASAVFAWMMWSAAAVAPVARGHLRMALVFLVASGAGPLALGPLAALGLRDSPAYALSIYFYLHAQYNGWFLFFLQAVALHELARRRPAAGAPAAGRALLWLGAGAVLTFAQSTLWLQPPRWVVLVAAAGGLAQLAGCAWLLVALRGAGMLFSGPVRVLMAVALSGWLAKHVLQAMAPVPALAGLASHRFVVIAFLHLVFLGVVTPALLAWGRYHGWLRDGAGFRLGAVVLLAGAFATETLLVGPATGLFMPASLPEWLFASAVVMALGAVAVAASAWDRREPGCESGFDAGARDVLSSGSDASRPPP